MTRVSPRCILHESGFRSAPSQRLFLIRPRRDQDQGSSRSLRSVLWVRSQGWGSEQQSAWAESTLESALESSYPPLVREGKIYGI